MEEEIGYQEQDLPKFASQLREKPFRIPGPSHLVFTGSGDSYAAAVFGQELSQGRAMGFDPYELLSKVDRLQGKTLVIVSISGKTKTNLELSRKAKGIATERIAITADASSKLAKECDRIVRLEYRKSRIPTSGTTSFTCGLLACAFLLGMLPKTVKIGTAVRKSTRWANSVRSSVKESFLFMGSGLDYAMALYGVAKIHEVIGGRAEAEFPEQLGHAHLFAIDKWHDAIVCIGSGLDKALQVGKVLARSGFRAYPLNVQGQDPVLNCLRIAVYLQQLVLKQARRRGLRECAFISDRRRLDLSSSLIY
jgi:fructoselysine-6-P-deglycase FrlB-like protein